MEKRKEKEMELHDHLRGDLIAQSRYQSNKKFYAISQINRDYVKEWFLQKGCAGRRILDYCCGNGDFAIWLAENEADAFGIDISSKSIENAITQAENKGIANRVKFIVMDAEKTEFPNEYFDFIAINGVLHHLNLEKAYQELARIMKPSGEIICTEALRHNPIIQLYRKMTPHLRSAWESEHILGRKEVHLANKYFEKVEINEFFHLFAIAAVPFRNLSNFNYLLKFFRAADSLLLKIPFLKWQAWMIIFILSQPKKS